MWPSLTIVMAAYNEEDALPLCAERTLASLQGEIDDMAAWLPAQRAVILGFYSTGHRAKLFGRRPALLKKLGEEA